jgi:hypothetical protein
LGLAPAGSAELGVVFNVAEGFTAICCWYLTTQEQAMNTFCEHHKNSINFVYRCFDRILLNGLIQPFQQPERVIGFFNAYREGKRVIRNLLRDIAQQFQNWVIPQMQSSAEAPGVGRFLDCPRSAELRTKKVSLSDPVLQRK